MEKGTTPTLLDIFKSQKAFQKFYKESYQKALKEES